MHLLAWLLTKLSRRFNQWWAEPVYRDPPPVKPGLQPDRGRYGPMSVDDYATHIGRHQNGEHVGRRYDDCHLCLEGEPDGPVIETSVPDGATYAPTVELPSRRKPECLFQCQNDLDADCTEACAKIDFVDVEHPAKAILEQAFPDAPEKRVEYPKAVDDMTITEWVDWRIGGGALNPDSLNRGIAGQGPLSGITLRVDRGFSMSYLREIVERANRKDMTLSLDQLAAARSRGLL